MDKALCAGCLKQIYYCNYSTVDLYCIRSFTWNRFRIVQSHISLKNKNEYTIVDLINQLIVDNVKKIQRKCQKYPLNASDHCIFIHFKRCCGGRYFCSLSVPCASANMLCMSVSHKTHVNSSVTQTSRHCVSLYLCTCVTRLTRWMR